MPVVKVPIVGSVSDRSASADKDFRLINGLVETLEQDSDSNRTRSLVVKRAGTTEHQDNSAATTDTGRGLYYWNGKLYSIHGNQIFADGADSWDTFTTMDDSTGRCYFDSIGGATPRLVIQDYTNDLLYITDSDNDNIVKQTDAQIPSSQAAGVVVLDTYICVMDTNGSIWSSEVGGNFTTDQSSWLATDFLNAEVIGDPGVRLCRHHNYLVALNEKSTEFFYNAANPTGESPFERVSGAVSFIGCPAGETAVNIDDELIFVAESHNGGRFVAKFDGFTPKPVSNRSINEYLNEEKTNITNAYAYQVKSMGHWLYILCLPTTAEKTFVYDLTEGEWSEWNTGTTEGETLANFPFYDSAFDAGVPLLQHNTSGKIYELDPGTYTDIGSNFELYIQTERWTGEKKGENVQNKFVYMASLLGDRSLDAGESDLQVELSWSDDDYQTWVTAGQEANFGNNRARYRRLGMTQRRAFRIVYDGDAEMRLEGLELYYRRGHYGF